MRFKLIIAIVDEERTDVVLQAAREAGSTGATVLAQARGEGLRRGDGAQLPGWRRATRGKPTMRVIASSRVRTRARRGAVPRSALPASRGMTSEARSATRCRS